MDEGVGGSEAPQRLRQRQGAHTQGGFRNFLWLSLGATGVVFGDTGTSPLYTYSGIFASELHTVPEAADVKGAFSMIFWVLTWTVCIKYLTFVMRASHHGEGGILALMRVALDGRAAVADVADAEPLVEGGANADKECVTLLGMLGCAALVGDSVVTPSISVLSAAELLGPDVGQGWKVLLAVLVLLCLFGLQKHGSKQIGEAAGPVMVCWFATIGVLGFRNLLMFQDQAWEVMYALNPATLVDFWTTGCFTGVLAWKAMAGVVLSITGAEALYSDMGHFGAKPIMFAWFMLVYPSLVLQYMGQSAVLMSNPEAISDLFASTLPPRAKCVLVFLSILATIQASQGLISGTFTLFSQARALGFVPRILVLHTNADVRGQVYIPEVNWALMIACTAMCVCAQTSQRLAGAYGITVTSAFVITTLLLWVVLRCIWRWRLLPALLLFLPMLLIDLTFWTSNLGKLLPLGWIPVVIGASAFLLMHVQRWGNCRKRDLFAQEAAAGALPRRHAPTLAQARTLDALRAVLAAESRPRTASAAVYLTPAAGRVPHCLRLSAAANGGALPELMLLLHVSFEDVPFVPEDLRHDFEAADPEQGLFSATVRFGWAEPPGAMMAGGGGEDDDPMVRSPGLHETVRRIARARRDRYPQLSQLDADSRPGEGAIYVINKTRYTCASRDDEAWAWLYDLTKRVARRPDSMFGIQDCNICEVDVDRRL
mmetsp:Transcript_99238/g.305953  ORF Transcript_99238/g.305953 Transcript_99238/m.305953 type:complete len:712 (-) Transcript_99238:125-2260(-)